MQEFMLYDNVTIEVARLAQDIELDILILPSYTLYVIQPLDICIFEPFKTYFKEYQDYWISKNLNHLI